MVRLQIGGDRSEHWKSVGSIVRVTKVQAFYVWSLANLERD